MSLKGVANNGNEKLNKNIFCRVNVQKTTFYFTLWLTNLPVSAL